MSKNGNSIMSLLLLTAVLAGCGSGEHVAEQTSGTETSTTPETTSMYEPDNLPADLDFAGKTVSILTWAENKEFCEEQTGEIVDDALYTRDRQVEERLNVELEHIGMSYAWSTREEYLSKVRSSVMAGDDTYQIVSGQYAVTPTWITDGCLVDLNKLDYLSFDKPWWISNIAEETSIAGKLYLMTGDITLQTTSSVSCLFVNQRLLEDYKLEDPIALVDSGKWTMDKLFSMSSEIYSDLNSDGSADSGDLYGFGFMSANGIYPFVQASGVRVTEMDKDNIPVLNYGTEKVIDIYDRIRAFLHDAEGVYYKHAEDAADALYLMFNDGRILFNAGAFGDARTRYNNMKDEFLVIPYPKYDEQQKEYRARLGESNTLFGITVTTAEPNMAAAVLEAMASESYRTVTPALYEVALKVKYSMNDDTARMFDLIRSGIAYDFGALYSSVTDIATQFRNNIWNNMDGWASAYASFESAHQAQINAFVESVRKLEN